MDENKHEAQVQTALRFPSKFLERVDKLAKKMSTPVKRMTRSEVLRIAALHGIEQLERKKTE